MRIIFSIAGRSSCPVVFCKKNEACNFIKEETLAQVFSCEFCESSKNIFFHRTPMLAVSAFAYNNYISI